MSLGGVFNVCVDLNSDLGESFGLGDGRDESVLQFVSSANIACGFHAGDPVAVLHGCEGCQGKVVAVGLIQVG